MDLTTARRNISKLEKPFFKEPSPQSLLPLVDAWRDYMNVRECFKELPNEYEASTKIRVYFGLMEIDLSTDDAIMLLNKENGYREFAYDLFRKGNVEV